MIAYADTALEDAVQAFLLTCVVATTGSITLTAVANGYTRTSGSFVADGFAAGMELTPVAFDVNARKVVKSVTALAIVTTGSVAPQSSGSGRSLTAYLPAARLLADESPESVPTTSSYVATRYLGGPSFARTAGAPTVLVESDVLYQVTLSGTMNMSGRAEKMSADAIVRHFGPFVSIAVEDSFVKPRRQPMPSHGGVGRSDDGRPQVVVTIPLRMYHRKS